MEPLHRPVVFQNIIVLHILKGPEVGQLVGGNLNRLDEVDPLDNLQAGGGGKGAVVAAIVGFRSISYWRHTGHKV